MTLSWKCCNSKKKCLPKQQRNFQNIFQIETNKQNWRTHGIVHKFKSHSFNRKVHSIGNQTNGCRIYVNSMGSRKRKFSELRSQPLWKSKRRMIAMALLFDKDFYSAFALMIYFTTRYHWTVIFFAELNWLYCFNNVYYQFLLNDCY